MLLIDLLKVVPPTVVTSIVLEDKSRSLAEAPRMEVKEVVPVSENKIKVLVGYKITDAEDNGTETNELRKTDFMMSQSEINKLFLQAFKK